MKICCGIKGYVPLVEDNVLAMRCPKCRREKAAIQYPTRERAQEAHDLAIVTAEAAR